MAVDTSSPAAPSAPTGPTGGRHRVVVIGSGFGGLWTAEALATVLLGRVTEIDLAERTVTSLSPLGSTMTSYDTLVVAAGAGQSYFGNDQFSEFAPGMKSIDDALELRGRIFGSFELAELCTDPAEVEEWLTFVVVGAGPTGVEMAGQIAELAHRKLRADFRRI